MAIDRHVRTKQRLPAIKTVIARIKALMAEEKEKGLITWDRLYSDEGRIKCLDLR